MATWRFCDLEAWPVGAVPNSWLSLRIGEHVAAGMQLAQGGTMQASDLRERTFRFATDVVLFCRAMPRTMEAREMGRQLLRAATSTAANYRATCRSRSRREFVAKLGVVVEEADECVFWLELLVATRATPLTGEGPLIAEARELRAILAVSHKTARRNLQAFE